MKSEDAATPRNPAASVNLEGNDHEPWTTIISPHRSWFEFNLSELWRYRDLMLLLVRRDLIAQYKQTILGPLWFVLQPLFTTLVFTVVFGRIAAIPTDGTPDFLFYFAGTICWGYFAGCLTQTADTLSTYAAVFGRVYFPRLVVPISFAVSNICKFLVQLALFLAFLLYYYRGGASVTVTPWVWALPVLVVYMALLGIGCGLLVASMTTRYRDLAMVAGFGVQLWMFATPVVYPLSQIPGAYRPYFALNPMTSVVEGFRAGFLGSSSLTPADIAVGGMMTLALLFAGLVLFSRVERTFMDTV